MVRQAHHKLGNHPLRYNKEGWFFDGYLMSEFLFTSSETINPVDTFLRRWDTTKRDKLRLREHK